MKESNLRESSFIWANGLHFYVVQAGPKTGKPVILLHGFPEFWRGWEKQIPPLAEAGFRVIVPDQRGYNLSDKPRGLSNYRMDVLAKDVIGLADALGFEKVGLVGHDWGGIIAWVVAALYPERVEKLAVINAPYTPVIFRTLIRHPEQLLRSLYIFFYQLPIAPEAILRNKNWGLLVEMMRRTSLPMTFSEADFDLYRQAWWRKDAMTSMLNWYRALLQRPVNLPFGPRFRMPVRLLWSGKDIALGRELGEASIKLCDYGEMIIFEEATHWIQHEEAERVNHHLLSFFQS